MIKTRPYKPLPARSILCLFVKCPVAGAVKTRLARGIGTAGALRFYRQSTRKLAMTLSQNAQWRIVLCVAPDSSRFAPPSCWPPHLDRQPQGPGDLGVKMGRIFKYNRTGPLLIIGSDTPQIHATHIRQAFATLKRTDFVFGPSPDGGYWLIGHRRGRPPLPLFTDVRWSTPDALEDTLTSIPAQYTIGYIDSLTDIDEVADLPLAVDRLCLSAP